MAKVFAVDTAIAVCQAAMESMGAWGLAVEAGVERCWRDAAMLTAIDGTARHAAPHHRARDARHVGFRLAREHAIVHAAHLGADRVPPRRSASTASCIPRSVAVFGASDSKDKFGGRIMHFLVRHGFPGEIYPINLRRTEVLGRRAYPDIGAAPAGVDVAILAVPSESLVRSVSEAAAAGVGGCVIISTGFAEAGEEGRARQAALVDDRAADRASAWSGPNCMGLIVPHHRLALCSSVVLDTDRLRDGPIGLVSQSGALMVSIFDRAGTDGIGFRHCVSMGNQVDLEICDFLEYLVEDAGTEAICLYVEGLLDGARFRRGLAAARARGQAGAGGEDRAHRGRRAVGALAHREPRRRLRGVRGGVPRGRRGAGPRSRRHGARGALPRPPPQGATRAAWA